LKLKIRGELPSIQPEALIRVKSWYLECAGRAKRRRRFGSFS